MILLIFEKIKKQSKSTVIISVYELRLKLHFHILITLEIF